MTYQRTCAIERAESDAPGQIGGILVSDGEASDGHILNIAGAKFPEQAPLLFGHDDFTGTGNLGSWMSFEKSTAGKLAVVRGKAQIELGGQGVQQDFRNDVNYMIEKKHIGQFSVRWDEISDPVRRVNLPSDHPAFVDSTKEKGRKLWGWYFEKWRLVEGSVVTLGADPAALIGRMHETEGDVRNCWRRTVNNQLTEVDDSGGKGLVGIELPDGSVAYVERAVYEAVMEGANERLQTALDLHEEIHTETMQLALGAGRVAGSADGPPGGNTVPGQEGQGRNTVPALEFDASQLVEGFSIEDLFGGFAEALETSEQRTREGIQQIVDSLTGNTNNAG
jgi:hypothetical protein